MGLIRYFSTFCAGMLVAGTPCYAQDDGKSSVELRAMSARTADRNARRDLSSILLPSGKYAKGMLVEVNSYWFQTRAYATSTEGVCAKDTLILNYQQIVPGKGSAANLVQPYGIESQRNYALLRAPRAQALDEERTSSEFQQREACIALGEQKDVSWISAESPEFLIQGWLAFDVAVNAVSSGSLSISRCSIGSAFVKRECVPSLLERHSFTLLSGVDRCEAEGKDRCFRLDINGMWVAFTVQAGADFQHLLASDIKNVTIDEYIVVT